jgi:uncharacterized repeat protein (TIGR03803 family)
MRHHRACRMLALSCSLVSVVAACGYDGGMTPPSSGLLPVTSSTPDGTSPSGLIQGSDGNLYGTTATGGQYNQGTVFRITSDGTETVLYSFAGGSSDGAQPNGGLIQGSDGSFYGTTNNGGIAACPRPQPLDGNAAQSPCGTVFRVTPTGAETVLYFFAGAADGGEPNGGLVQGSDGSFYGTTDSGGLDNGGVVFKVTPAGAESAIYAFGSQMEDGAIPSSLTLGADGSFYGTTTLGGQPNEGTIFKVTPTGAETLLYSFSGGADGDMPQQPLVLGSDGSLYGTTEFGGVSTNQPVAPCLNGGCGSVFRITPDGALTVLYAFGGNATDGAYPTSGLIQGKDGTLYGTTGAGGLTSNCSGGCGVAFSITPDGAAAILYLFRGGSMDGADPSGALVQALDGNVYGTTAQGGEFNEGTVFRITPTGVETVLHSFGGGTAMNP